MKPKRSRTAFVALAVLAGAPLEAELLMTSTEDAGGHAGAVDQAEAATDHWEFGASAYLYLVPDDRSYLQPTVTVDRGGLHLEARYNNEALETGSLWLGCNLAGGKALAWELTPMMGGVLGKAMGVAPGLHGTLSWWRLEFSVDGEYMLDTGDQAGSFLYSWSELTLAPWESFRFGFAAQRTRAYQSELDIQRGVMAGFTYRALDLSAYVFNPDEAEPTVVLAVSVSL